MLVGWLGATIVPRTPAAPTRPLSFQPKYADVGQSPATGKSNPLDPATLANITVTRTEPSASTSTSNQFVTPLRPVVRPRSLVTPSHFRNALEQQASMTHDDPPPVMVPGDPHKSKGKARIVDSPLKPPNHARLLATTRPSPMKPVTPKPKFVLDQAAAKASTSKLSTATLPDTPSSLTKRALALAPQPVPSMSVSRSRLITDTIPNIKNEALAASIATSTALELPDWSSPRKRRGGKKR